MKFNIKQKILSTIFACVFILASAIPALRLTSIICILFGYVLLIIALSDQV